MLPAPRAARGGAGACSWWEEAAREGEREGESKSSIDRTEREKLKTERATVFIFLFPLPEFNAFRVLSFSLWRTPQHRSLLRERRPSEAPSLLLRCC